MTFLDVVSNVQIAFGIMMIALILTYFVFFKESDISKKPGRK